jgi:hypothetical protein
VLVNKRNTSTSLEVMVTRIEDRGHIKVLCTVLVQLSPHAIAQKTTKIKSGLV